MQEGAVVEHEETPAVEEEPAARRYPSTIGGALYVLMLLVVLVGIVVVALASWRVGVRIFGGALVVGAGMRLVLKEHDAGMFAVRTKSVDAALHMVVGGTLIALAGIIPDQPV